MITYTWSFPKLHWQDKGGLAKVVISVHWECVGVDDETETSARVYGQSTVGDPDPASFTSWASLTPEAVKGFLPDELVDDAQAKVASKINAIDNPPATEGEGVPWRT